MNTNDTCNLIQAAGGDTEFAKLLGIDNKPGYQQRVNNWKRRGIPSGVIVKHYQLIEKLRIKGQPKASA